MSGKENIGQVAEKVDALHGSKTGGLWSGQPYTRSIDVSPVYGCKSLPCPLNIPPCLKGLRGKPVGMDNMDVIWAGWLGKIMERR